MAWRSIVFSVVFCVGTAEHTDSHCPPAEAGSNAMCTSSLIQQASHTKRVQFAALHQWAANVLKVDADSIHMDAPNLTHMVVNKGSPTRCRVCIRNQCGGGKRPLCSGWSPSAGADDEEGWSPEPVLKDEIQESSKDVGLSRCSADSGYARGSQELYLHADQGAWPQGTFCNTAPEGFANHSGGTYTVSAQLYNVNSNRGAQFGHPGLAYNVQSADTYEFVYFRPHSHAGCLQTGQLRQGVVHWANAQSAACPGGQVPGGAWFRVDVKVAEGFAHIYKDGQKQWTQTNSLPPLATGAMIVANGYDNSAKFKDFAVTVPCLPLQRVKMECRQ